MTFNLNEKINAFQIRLRAMFDRDPMKIDDTGEGRWMTILISFFVILVGALVAHYLLFAKIERSLDIDSGETNSVLPASLDTMSLKKVNEYYKNKAMDYERSLSSPDQFVDPSR